MYHSCVPRNPDVMTFSVLDSRLCRRGTSQPSWLRSKDTLRTAMEEV
jgi:hypothetical protein